MSFGRTLNRCAKIGLLSQNMDVSTVLFETGKSQRVCHLFLKLMKDKNGLTRQELSKLAWDLDQGAYQGLKYRRTTFYRQIRKTLLALGLVEITYRSVEPEQDLMGKRGPVVVQKYVPVRQPISKRPPDGLNLVRLTWILCSKWNEEFWPEDKKDDADALQ